MSSPGNVQYTGVSHTNSFFFPMNFPTFIMISPTILMISPWCTEHAPLYCTVIMQEIYCLLFFEINFSTPFVMKPFYLMLQFEMDTM